MQDFHKLEVWKKAHHLTLNVFKAADQQAMRDSFLSAQLHRTGVVISTRITEGCTKENNVEFARCLYLSRASCYELAISPAICNISQSKPTKACSTS